MQIKITRDSRFKSTIMHKEGCEPPQRQFENDTKFNYVVSFNFENNNFHLYFELTQFLKLNSYFFCTFTIIKLKTLILQIHMLKLPL